MIEASKTVQLLDVSNVQTFHLFMHHTVTTYSESAQDVGKAEYDG